MLGKEELITIEYTKSVCWAMKEASFELTIHWKNWKANENEKNESAIYRKLSKMRRTTKKEAKKQ